MPGTGYRESGATSEFEASRPGLSSLTVLQSQGHLLSADHSFLVCWPERLYSQIDDLTWSVSVMKPIL